MNRARSISPGLMLLAHPVADEVHGPMKGGRNNDDGDESEPGVPREEPRDRPGGNGEAQEERADDEVVLVEADCLRTPRQMHAPLHERADEVAEEGAEREDGGGGEGRRGRPERPRGRRSEDLEGEGEEEPEDRAGDRASNESSPRLAVPEEPLAVREVPSEVDRGTAPEQDRHGVRHERGEEEPQGLGDRLKGHGAAEGPSADIGNATATPRAAARF